MTFEEWWNEPLTEDTLNAGASIEIVAKSAWNAGYEAGMAHRHHAATDHSLKAKPLTAPRLAEILYQWIQYWNLAELEGAFKDLAKSLEQEHD